ncbi:hypothetical protein AALP_AA5G174500 [Arabis alpina]|uniref:FBD domain-containing protein n=1 Tax=Arabis alpina TaxID=50452 RepID=A0A087GXQ5_ARAAL|nr:hypothetical protein AALP_AA5G174500 [Arabis alpina]
MDRLSNLPDEIICHIASFLSAKEAAFTTVLSKRYLNLYNIIPNLEFDGSLRSFTDFVDGVLALPASTRIKRCSLKSKGNAKQAHYAHINRCLCDVLNRGVLDLELHMFVGKRYSLPFEVFTCKTVVKLKLGNNFVINALPNNASLPALETLILDHLRFKDRYGCAFEKLLSACIVLKELTINGMEWECWKWSGNVSSPTLQRLIIHRHGDNFYEFAVARITLNTPSLTYLECLDVIPDEYPIVNLDSLVEAKLNLMLTVNHIYDGLVDDSDIITSNPTNLIKGLRNVQIMNLTTPTFQTFYYFNEALPVFAKLHHLTITPLDEEFCWQFLPFLIKKAPNLETLTIDGPLHFDVTKPRSVCKCLFGYSFLFSCPLKVLHLTDYGGTIGEVKHLKHYLKKLSRLELVKLHYWQRAHDVRPPSLMIPVVPSKCKIEVTYS